LSIDLQLPDFSSILVDDDEEAGANFWRSKKQSEFDVEIVQVNSGAVVFATGRVKSAEQFVLVEPSKLAPETKHEWRVRVWLDEGDEPTAFSEPTVFITEPRPTSWEDRGAQWIGGGNQLRSTFELPATSTIKSAHAFVTGMGAFYLSINGKRVGDHVMDPVRTVYDVRTLFLAFGVVSMLFFSVLS
jgi:alpha-L-rhamnosidase